MSSLVRSTSSKWTRPQSNDHKVRHRAVRHDAIDEVTHTATNEKCESDHVMRTASEAHQPRGTAYEADTDK